MAGQIKTEFETGVKNGGELYITADQYLLEKARAEGIVAEQIPLAQQRPVVAIREGHTLEATDLESLAKSTTIKFGISSQRAAVGKMVRKWSIVPIICAVVGCAIAVSMLFLGRAEQSENPIYLGLCGVVAICSMIIPGLSGSFVLLLMGNYELVMIDAVNNLTSDPAAAIASATLMRSIAQRRGCRSATWSSGRNGSETSARSSTPGSVVHR